jgi:putative ABC transport system permease protein
MPVLFRIAFRNIMEHKAKSLIIGILIAVGVVVLIVGNAFMDTAALGIQRAFIDNYTGHIMISGVSEEGRISLFGVQSPGQRVDTPTIPHYRDVLAHVQEMEGVTAYTPQLTSFGIIGPPEDEGRTFSLVFGIEPGTYTELFSNIEFIEGRHLMPGEEGIVMSVNQIELLKKEIAREQGAEVEELDMEFHA